MANNIGSSITRAKCPTCKRGNLILTADGKLPEHWDTREGEDHRCGHSGQTLSAQPAKAKKAKRQPAQAQA